MRTFSTSRGRQQRAQRDTLPAVALRCLLFAPLTLSTACYGTLSGDSEDVDSQSQYGYGSSDGAGSAPPIELPLEPIPEETIPYTAAAAIIDKTCTLSKCHGQDEEPLIMVDGTLPQFLQTTLVEECGNVPLITPGDLSKSALILLVTRQCGELVMPDTCRTDPCLLPKDLATMQAWILQGAPFQ